MHQNAQKCTEMHRNADKHRNAPECTGMHWTKHRNKPKYTWIYTNTAECTGMHPFMIVRLRNSFDIYAFIIGDSKMKKSQRIGYPE